MLIYHKTNDKLKITEVIHGVNSITRTFIIKDFSKLQEKDKQMVSSLANDGDIYITGATFKDAIYSGMICKRTSFSYYLEN